jgi:hypothetical protein
MDAAWWKLASQVLVFAASAAAGLGGMGVWYFGRLDDQAKDRVAQAREAVLSERVGQLVTSNGRLESQNAGLSHRLDAVHAGIKELVSQGQLSRPEAERLIRVIISESLSLQEDLKVEVKRGTPGAPPR